MRLGLVLHPQSRRQDLFGWSDHVIADTWRVTCSVRMKKKHQCVRTYVGQPELNDDYCRACMLTSPTCDGEAPWKGWQRWGTASVRGPVSYSAEIFPFPKILSPNLTRLPSISVAVKATVTKPPTSNDHVIGESAIREVDLCRDDVDSTFYQAEFRSEIRPLYELVNPQRSSSAWLNLVPLPIGAMVVPTR